jgi:hypothetical protein
MEISEIIEQISNKPYDQQKNIHALIGKIVLEDAMQGKVRSPERILELAMDVLHVYREVDHA